MSPGSGDDDREKRRKTLPGMVAPSAPLSQVDPADRVTLDFSGPPLALPGEDPLPSAPSQLDLDTSDLDRPSPGALDLDMSDFAEEEVSSSPEPDAWVRDRIARGSGMHRSVTPPTPTSSAPPDDPTSLPPDEGTDAIGLVDRSRPSQAGPDDLAGEMADRYALGDFTGALRAAELVLGRDPERADARQYAESSRERLVQLYSSRLGSMSRTPQVAVPDSEVRWLGLDHRAGFLLSRIDGTHSIEEVIDVSGMPRLEALKMLTELLEAGAITLQ